MDRDLDPLMQAILDGASGNVEGYSKGSIHPSQLSNRFSYDAVERRPVQTSLEPLFSSRYSHSFQGSPRNESGLDDFDRNRLNGSRFSSQQFLPINQQGRVSMPYNREMTTSSSIRPSCSQLSSSQAMTPFLTANEVRQVYPKMDLPGPSRVQRTNVQKAPLFTTDQFGYAPTQPSRYGKYPPLFDNDQFSYTSPEHGQYSRETSPPFAVSSPTQRISLRREVVRPTKNPWMLEHENETEIEYGQVNEQFAIPDCQIFNSSETVSQDINHLEQFTALEHHRNRISRSKTSIAHRQLASPIASGIQLVSPNELPKQFRKVFPYLFFNAVQSKCFEPVYNTTDNVVISAPTGSGKTAILELAICKLVECYDVGQFKIVYQAPTRSLCAERVRDWQEKFNHINLPCAELTGDTDAVQMQAVGNAAIIVTTPEKWDSITRKWKDHMKLLKMVKLFLIDEVHILKDVRGATLEAVVSRMKSIGVQVRFIALSATVPNSQDIAMWLGKDATNGDIAAHQETFGEEFRPVKLEKHVYGFDKICNDFAFDTFLDSKLPVLVAKHARGKPIMVFCFTRKSCETTATKLADWWSNSPASDRAWPWPEKRVAVSNKELQDLVSNGIAFHHAGLESQDRLAVETAFLKGHISVICCTSTLAVGVNLPCHLVVIKNTVGYQEDGLKEYSDLELMQMLGRAGRPQFDKEAIAIIVTRSSNVNRYTKMIAGQEVIESTLHLNLIEHLNSEISLGTVNSVATAKTWLAGTFLSVRMKRNPTYYKFDCDRGSRDTDERLQRIIERDIMLLQNTKLITSKQILRCTDYGAAMSKFMVSFQTMKSLTGISKYANLGQILHVIAQATEFKDLRMKPTERIFFRELNKSCFIKFPIKENITTVAHKVSLMIQVQLGGVDLPLDREFSIVRRQFVSEQIMVLERAKRLVMCVVECKISDCDSIASHNALELSRSLAAGFWENSPFQLRQIDGIGPVAVRRFVQSDVKSVETLASLASFDIERILSRNPPFGTKILNSVQEFPRLILKAAITKNIIINSGSSVKVQVKASLNSFSAKSFWQGRPISVTFFASVSSGKMAHVWRGNIQKLLGGLELDFACLISNPADIIMCHVSCDKIVGTVRSVNLRLDVPASSFPSKKSPEDALKNEDSDFEWDEAEEGDYLAAVDTAESAMKKGTLALESTIAPRVMLEQQNNRSGDNFNGFIDIDEFEGELISEEDRSPLVQRPDGKWDCKHPCKDGNTKKGGPCKHKCCILGLERPPKLSNRNRVDKKNENSQGRSNLELPRFRLRDSNELVVVNKIEEIDLAENLSPAPELDFFSHSPADEEEGYDDNDSDLPMPSQLIMGTDPFVYDAIDSSDFFRTASPVGHSEALNSTPPKPSENFTNEIFDFGAFQSEQPSLALDPNVNRKRDPPSSPVMHEAKRVKDSESEIEQNMERELPEWTKELPGWIIDYFKPSCDFVP